MRHHVGEMLLTGRGGRFTVADGFVLGVGAVSDGVVGWSALAVHGAVPPQHGRAGEALSTGVAGVRFLPSVGTYVTLKVP